MKIELLGYRFRFDLSLIKLASVDGINSLVDSDKNTHILLWDFDTSDNNGLVVVQQNLLAVQRRFMLPTIRIVSTKHGYHAYCFTEKTYADTVFILSSTPCIDTTYFKLGIIRGYWTLRITPKSKQGDTFKLTMELPSPVPENLTLTQRVFVNQYITGVKK